MPDFSSRYLSYGHNFGHSFENRVTALQAHVDKSPYVGGWEINGGTSWYVKTKGKYAMAGRTFENDMRSETCVIGN